MAKNRIVINLPDSGVSKAVMKGHEKRLRMMETMLKEKKKKKKGMISPELKEMRGLLEFENLQRKRRVRDIEGKQDAILTALSSLGKLSKPSPS